MLKYIKLFFILVLCLTLFSCNKEDKSVIKLSDKNVEFKSQASQQTIISRAKGFYLDAIIVNGKDVSIRYNDSEGSLVLMSSWLTVVTPGFSGDHLAKTMILKAKANNTDSKRECEVLVHNGNEKIYIKVSQDKVKNDE